MENPGKVGVFAREKTNYIHIYLDYDYDGMSWLTLHIEYSRDKSGIINVATYSSGDSIKDEYIVE